MMWICIAALMVIAKISESFITRMDHSEELKSRCLEQAEREERRLHQARMRDAERRHLERLRLESDAHSRSLRVALVEHKLGQKVAVANAQQRGVAKGKRRILSLAKAQALAAKQGVVVAKPPITPAVVESRAITPAVESADIHDAWIERYRAEAEAAEQEAVARCGTEITPTEVEVAEPDDIDFLREQEMMSLAESHDQLSN
jgi:hypothetical protein